MLGARDLEAELPGHQYQAAEALSMTSDTEIFPYGHYQAGAS